MSRFLRLTKLPPIDQFISDLIISRLALEEAYLNAWQATRNANRMMDEELQSQFVEPDEQDPLGIAWLQTQTPAVDTHALHREAQEQDRRADVQAMLVIHCADQWLRRLAFALCIPRDRRERGFGKDFNGVSLTSLLRETMNCARHAGEWDDSPSLVVPYDPDTTTGNNVKRPLESIAVLKKALGIGKHDRICEAPCWTVLKVFDGEFLDGKLGESQPDYGRFEFEVIGAAREIVAEGAPHELAAFDKRFPQRAIA